MNAKYSPQEEFACPTQPRTLHFDLKHCDAQADLLLHANGRRYRLERHTTATLRQAIAALPLLSLIPEDHITHYIKDLPLPSTRTALISVSVAATVGTDLVRKTVVMSIHVPQAGVLAAQAKIDLDHAAPLSVVPSKLQAYGVSLAALEVVARALDFSDQLQLHVDAHETAVALLYHHPDLMNLNSENSQHIKTDINTAIDRDGGTFPYVIRRLGDDWSTKVPLLDENHQPMRNPSGQIIYTMRLDPDVTDASKGPLGLAIKLTRQNENLRNHLWHVLDGVASSEYQGSADGSFAPRKSLESAQDSNWKLKNLTPSHGVTISSQVGYDSNYMTLTCANSWLRHLGAYAEFLNAAGQTISPPSNWPDSGLPSMFAGSTTKKYIDWLGPVTEISGIPINSTSKTLRFPIPEGASEINLYLAGLGTAGHFDSDICLLGTALTLTIEYAVPVLLMAAGASINNTQWIQDLLEEHQVFIGMLGVLAALQGAIIEHAMTGSVKDVLVAVGNFAVPLLFKTGLKAILLRVIGEAALEDAIPFVDVVFAIYNVLVDASLLLQTTAEVLSAPTVYKTSVTRTIDLNLTINPDSGLHMFPMQANHYTVTVTYNSPATQPVKEFPLKTGTHSDPLHISFQDIPAGGQLMVNAVFYAPNGWVAGTGKTPWMNALGTQGNTLIAQLEVTNNKPPLTGQSVYTHLEKISYQGQHLWTATSSPPTATLQSSANADLQGLNSITMAQAPGSIGYAWQATNLNIPENDINEPPSRRAMYTVQNISLLQRPQDAYQPLNVGYTRKSGICYELFSKTDGSGRNFFVDSNPDAQGWTHLRKVDLSYEQKPVCGPLTSGSGTSYGRFPAILDDYVLHPQGFVFGINTLGNKLLKCELAKSAVPDARAPGGSMMSGEGVRAGLMQQPVAVAVGLDGVVMVLESGNARVQAFDINGNPIKYFHDKTASFMQLLNRGQSTYLDMDVEAKGYIYVLSAINGGHSAADHYLDIYQPDGTILVTTRNVAAGKLTVSLLRDVYTLNYELIRGAANRPEPSVSHWIPPAPQ